MPHVPGQSTSAVADMSNQEISVLGSARTPTVTPTCAGMTSVLFVSMTTELTTDVLPERLTWMAWTARDAVLGVVTVTCASRGRVSWSGPVRAHRASPVITAVKLLHGQHTYIGSGIYMEVQEGQQKLTMTICIHGPTRFRVI
ncbi:uncharacterized protein LOC144906348 [Branchiostoma floridae x Branchiostoma belcheri]